MHLQSDISMKQASFQQRDQAPKGKKLTFLSTTAAAYIHYGVRLSCQVAAGKGKSEAQDDSKGDKPHSHQRKKNRGQLVS